MIYQGGAWPEKYRGAVFMNNIHGNRMNMDLLEPHGSGFVAHHGQTSSSPATSGRKCST